VNDRPHFVVWLLGALLAAGIAFALATSAIEEAEEAAITVTTTTTQAAGGEHAVTASTTTTTTIPDIEALIPLSVDSIRNDVAQSVGFVLSQQGTGSGVVISEDLMVTNAHVAWPDYTVSIVFLNGATHQGRVLALDPFVDLAIVDISGLSRRPAPIEIGSTADLDVGDELFVVGYPSPDEFTPEPTVDSGAVVGFTDWEFTGVEWVTVAAPAIGGQSGGAVIDEYGRLVGISTFGSDESLTSISIDDVLEEVDRMLESTTVRGLGPRVLPHAGARRANDISLEGEWDQQLLFGWWPSETAVSVAWAGGDGTVEATTIAGGLVAAADDAIELVPEFTFPVVVFATAGSGSSEGTIESSLPLIAYEDPDHGKHLERGGATPGIFEVSGDMDFFYIDLVAGEELSIALESAARTRLRIYGPDGDELAKDIDLSGFIGNDASVEITAEMAGRHVVAVESTMSTVSGYMVIVE